MFDYLSDALDAVLPFVAVAVAVALALVIAVLICGPVA